MITAALVSAAKPCTGCSFTILWPSVRMIRQPPAAVPAAMVAAQRIIPIWRRRSPGVLQEVEQGRKISNAPLFVPVKRASAMMPIVFCASFVPWLCAIQAALINCAFPKIFWTMWA